MFNLLFGRQDKYLELQEEYLTDLKKHSELNTKHNELIDKINEFGGEEFLTECRDIKVSYLIELCESANTPESIKLINRLNALTRVFV